MGYQIEKSHNHIYTSQTIEACVLTLGWEAEVKTKCEAPNKLKVSC